MLKVVARDPRRLREISARLLPQMFFEELHCPQVQLFDHDRQRLAGIAGLKVVICIPDLAECGDDRKEKDKP